MSIAAIPSASGYAAAAQPATPARQAAADTALSRDDLVLLDKLKSRDTEVRQHEQAHMAAAGGLALSGPTYTYQRGPNGVNYAVGGEVQIDTSPGATPEETVERARAMQAAALAPAQPSDADRAVAAQAQQMEQQARAELAERQRQSVDGGRLRQAYNTAPLVPPVLDIYA
ncbi:putative metalloprotease CJM1_0395 family protein [Oxalobacteraceae bacterium A2-2]